MHLIIGAGSVGTVLAGCLLNAGERVTLVVPPGRLDWYSQASELEVTANNGQIKYQHSAPRIVEMGSAIDFNNVSHVYIATKYSGLDAVLHWLFDAKLPPNIQVISCLNGIAGKLRAAERLNRQITFMTVMFNARRDAALNAALTTKEIIQFEDTRSPLATLFANGGATVQHGSTAGMWGKLLINLNNSICALCNSSFQDMFSDPTLKAIYIAVLDESTALMERQGVEYKLPMPLSWRQFRWFSKNAGWVLSLAAKYLNGLTKDSVPSMVADMRARRPTEVNELNGELVRIAEQLGCEAPLNKQIISLVKAMEAGEEYTPFTPPQLAKQLKVEI